MKEENKLTSRKKILEIGGWFFNKKVTINYS
jgi:hypothetical protein